LTEKYEAIDARGRFEVGDEVVGDEHIHGVIIGTKDVCQVIGGGETIREYLVTSHHGGTFLYAGEANLRLVKKGMGDAAPPRAKFLVELDDDLRWRPLAGLRL